MKDKCGWVGMFLILLGYIASTRGYLNPQDTSYLVINLVGAIGLCVSASEKRAYALLTLNLIWAAIASWGLICG